MNKFPLPLTRLIHENLSIVMTFAYSRGPLEKLVRTEFGGEWKHLNKAIFEISETRANRACMEIALFLRILDDEEMLSARIQIECGWLIMKDQSKNILRIRDVANKIIHATTLEWSFAPRRAPRLISHSRDSERWLRAEIDIVSVAAMCGSLAS